MILTPGVSVSRSHAHLSIFKQLLRLIQQLRLVRGFGMVSTGNLSGVWFKVGTSVLKNGEENGSKEERNGECLRHRR